MALVICTLFENPAIWKYVFPLNVILIGFFLMGIGLEMLFLKRGWKWFLFPLICLGLAVCSDYIYYVTGTFEAFAIAIFGMMAYLTFSGSAVGMLIDFVWTKVRS